MDNRIKVTGELVVREAAESLERAKAELEKQDNSERFAAILKGLGIPSESTK